MTVYLRFIELGTLAGSGRLLHIGAASSDDPSFVVDSNGTNYRVVHTNSSSVNSTVGTPAIGSIVELRAALFPDGAVQIHISVNGGSESSGSKSGALALDTAWGLTRIYLGSRDGSNPAFTGFHKVAISRGVQTRAFMRTYGE
jgi:hypothetical protein